jgi:hypothetical protein
MDDRWSEDGGGHQLNSSSPLSPRNLSMESLSDSRLNLLNRKGPLGATLSPSASYVNQLEAARGSVVGPLEVSREWERLLAYPPVNQLEAARGSVVVVS